MLAQDTHMPTNHSLVAMNTRSELVLVRLRSNYTGHVSLRQANSHRCRGSFPKSCKTSTARIIGCLHMPWKSLFCCGSQYGVKWYASGSLPSKASTEPRLWMLVRCSMWPRTKQYRVYAFGVSWVDTWSCTLQNNLLDAASRTPDSTKPLYRTIMYNLKVSDTPCASEACTRA